MDESNAGPMRPSPERARRSHVIQAIGASALVLMSAAVSAGSVSYAYDALGRLAKAIYNNGMTTMTISYSYDAAGNRTSVATTSP